VKVALERSAIAALLILSLLQLVPVERGNPPVEQEIAAPPRVAGILHGSCYDCHSNQSAWPWYGYVAPFSWLVAHDVEEGREHLNFSTWGRCDEEERAELLEELLEEVEHGEMPPWTYTLLHPGSALTAEELATLRAWARDGYPEAN